jgi:hypothetical protein
MNLNRIEILKQYIEEDPQDAFNHYALAVEYMKALPEEATQIFEYLLSEHANYLATYYTAAKHFEQLGLEDQAIAIIKKGLTVAREQQANKAFQELSSYLEQLEF